MKTVLTVTIIINTLNIPTPARLLIHESHTDLFSETFHTPRVFLCSDRHKMGPSAES